jgi:hypothetical protein
MAHFSDILNKNLMDQLLVTIRSTQNLRIWVDYIMRWVEKNYHYQDKIVRILPDNICKWDVVVKITFSSSSVRL